MNDKIYFSIALFFLGTVIYKMVTCLYCEEMFFGFEVSWLVKIAINGLLAMILFYVAYIENKKLKSKN